MEVGEPVSDCSQPAGIGEPTNATSGLGVPASAPAAGGPRPASSAGSPAPPGAVSPAALGTAAPRSSFTERRGVRTPLPVCRCGLTLQELLQLPVRLGRDPALALRCGHLDVSAAPEGADPGPRAPPLPPLRPMVRRSRAESSFLKGQEGVGFVFLFSSKPFN